MVQLGLSKKLEFSPKGLVKITSIKLPIARKKSNPTIDGGLKESKVMAIVRARALKYEDSIFQEQSIDN
jgi:hypothetical protein